MKLTKAQARRAWEWFAREMGIADWEVTLYLQDTPPVWAAKDDEEALLGLTSTLPAYKRASIWIKSGLTIEEDQISTLFHEGMHVCAVDTGIESERDPPTEHTEFLWNRLGDVLAKAYRR